MIKLLVKLAIVALVANAAYRVGSEYLSFIRFRDGVREVAMYRAKSDEDLRIRVVGLATDYDIPLGGNDLAIDRQNRRVTVSGDYRKPIELVPGYVVQWPFNLSVDVEMSATTPLPGAPTPR
ncbi:MAG: hypothetical protein GEU82_14840 [Luteitalea sp.]|nr:hypothetical protein [Luteitalea sp.]